MTNLTDIGKKAGEIILTVGDYLRKEFNQVQTTDIEFKQRNHLVSYVDKTAEKRLVEQLDRLIPNASFLVEEGTVDQSDDAWQWIIDPLDGTTNFLHHIPLRNSEFEPPQRDLYLPFLCLIDSHSYGRQTLAERV